MSIIHNTAHKLGSGLAKKVRYDRDKEQILTYVFIRMLNNLIFLSLLLSLSYFTNVEKITIDNITILFLLIVICAIYTIFHIKITIVLSILTALGYILKLSIPLSLLFVLIFLPLRSRFGGWHVKSDYMCLTISVIAPLIVAFISKSININYMFIMIIYLFAYITAIKLGVVDNPNKRLKDEKKNKFKKQGIIALTTIIFIHILFIFNGYILISNVISISVFLAFFNLYFEK